MYKYQPYQILQVHHSISVVGFLFHVRKDYLKIFKEISVATATRDMKKGIELKAWTKIGDNRTTKYKINPGHNNR